MKATVTESVIAREILIEAPAEVVWRTITEPAQIQQWFADHVELDARPGGAGTFRFDDEAGATTHTAVLTVEAIDPPHRFSFRWSAPEGETPVAGNSVLVDFTLTPEGAERTRLRVVETGYDALGWSDEQQADYVADHNQGWGVHMGRLDDLFRGAG